MMVWRAALLLSGLAMPSIAVADPVASVGHPFALRAADGRIVTDRTFARDVQVVVFGFTYCLDVCPTTLAAVAAATKLLGPAGKRVRVVFISVDPARDDPATLARYVQAFGADIVGVTGSGDALVAAARAFRTSYRVAPDGRGGIAVSHSGLVYLFAPGGRFEKVLPPGTTPARYAEELGRLLKSPAGPRP